ncbi:MAG: bifunctional phosphoserine phosphatase/homoserine phosphotransferase ThrH [Desulfobacterales bacterium]|nr:bifunctional phosphoserine phosphatase/homoserine phosphotransferase ThrH [Desulfobacterales bacterium]MBF0396250.1 bifunctional phosphoserine phosphatase/homoserine phosphotransferase ThrH [Desulfobacterales bacterium]
MKIVCSDLEGVFVPEIWINVSKKTGIEDLKLTTRDIPDYDVLMKKRISILKQHNLKLQDIQMVIANMEPLAGALEFINWLRENTQLIIVSDTFTQFAGPLMAKLGYPTLFCNTLLLSDNGTIEGYKLRQNDGKRKVAQALKTLNYKIIAMGDSYNDINMLKEGDYKILFRPPENIKNEYPDFPVLYDYMELKNLIQNILGT